MNQEIIYICFTIDNIIGLEGFNRLGRTGYGKREDTYMIMNKNSKQDYNKVYPPSIAKLEPVVKVLALESR